MKQAMTTLAVACFAAGTLACAQAQAPTQEEAPAAAPAPAEDMMTPAEIDQAIRGLEQRWVDAILAGDTAAIQEIVADDFIGTTDDEHYTKADAIMDVETGTHNMLEITSLEVHVFADNVAVTTFDQTEESMHGTEDFSGAYTFTNVWVYRNGQWQAVASHGSRLR